ncbi:FAD-binding protein [Youngiibacter fragilis]|uniref:F420H2:quinone oxidoreductase n=1 Tax=Youngiibacter fragilis 232.1 TaxID=994573 RepID=V7I2Q7_9CLOT|nr:FAD-binding protein [Youngiibacter fragilis]ETA79297.1 F420H2:quinone oxidoreductase [Youngiibacter fragilis 232.1]
MKLKKRIETDILVIGSGIAGVCAAVSAAREGRSVLLTSSANTFSGSTFYPGTWGFGLVGPDGEEDTEELLETIRTVGSGMINEKVARAFAEGLNSSVDELEALGVELMKPSGDASGEKEYIPCFDHKHRRWRGLTKKNLLRSLPSILEESGVKELPFFQMTEIVMNDGRASGAVGVLNRKDTLYIAAKAVVLASGGLGGLYRRRLTTDDVDATGTAAAMRAGAEAVNLEFMQIMLGFVRPAFKTIYNEKTFFASRFTDREGNPFIGRYLPFGLKEQEVLDARSLHGPFSSETVSRYLDIAFSKEMAKGNTDGMVLRYDLERLNSGSEFVKEYFRWLKDEKGVSAEEEIILAPFMHASNGGIEIDENAKTSVPGLFACGECTGGMHGADRIGGLSTANGIVFGMKAGRSAAGYAEDKELVEEAELEAFNIADSKEKLEALRETMYRDAFIARSSESIEKVRDFIGRMELAKGRGTSDSDYLDSNRLLSSVEMARACIEAMDLRKESRGSHYREDHPYKDESLGKMIRVRLKKVRLKKGEPIAAFTGGTK